MHVCPNYYCIARLTRIITHIGMYVCVSVYMPFALWFFRHGKINCVYAANIDVDYDDLCHTSNFWRERVCVCASARVWWNASRGNLICYVIKLYLTLNCGEYGKCANTYGWQMFGCRRCRRSYPYIAVLAYCVCAFFEQMTDHNSCWHHSTTHTVFFFFGNAGWGVRFALLTDVWPSENSNIKARLWPIITNIACVW